MLDVNDFFNIIINNILIVNVTGRYVLFEIYLSGFQLNYGKLEHILTYASFIFHILECSISISNLSATNFYPQLLYATYSSISMTHSSFSSSNEKFGYFEVCAMYLEYNTTFTIENSSFESLKNFLNGPVNYFS